MLSGIPRVSIIFCVALPCFIQVNSVQINKEELTINGTKTDGPESPPKFCVESFLFVDCTLALAGTQSEAGAEAELDKLQFMYFRF